MSISQPQVGPSSDIELSVLTSHARSIQPRGQALPSGSISESNPEIFTTIPSDVPVDGLKPPTPAYFLPSTDILPIPSSEAGLLDDTRMIGHPETPLFPGQRAYDGTSVQANDVHAEALPAYRTDNPPVYSQHASEELTTWPMLCFKLGFIFPFFWLYGALTLITPQDSLSRLCIPWFQDFTPFAESWCDDNFLTEAEKEVYLARLRAVEMTWAKRCLFAFSLVLCFAVVVAVIIVGIAKEGQK